MRLSDFVEINPRVKLERGKEYSCVMMENVTPRLRYVSAQTQRIFKGGSVFQAGDTLFARITPCLENGKIAQFKGANTDVGFGSTEFFVFRAREGISDPAFVFYLASSDLIRKPAEKSMFGASGRQRADLGVVQQTKVPNIPLSTQCKIAAILSAYDDLIENNTRRIKILEEMARLIYREWFVNFRFPGHEKVKMVNSRLGKVPEGWEVVRLQDVATFHRGRSYRTPDLAEEGGLPFLNLKCIERGGGFRHDGIKRYIGVYKPEQIARTGDLIVAVTDMTQERRLVAHAARVHLVGESVAVMSMDLVKIEPKQDIPKDYLHGVLRFSDFADEVSQHANGVNVLHLNPTQIQEFRFVLPPTDLRNQYAEFCRDAYLQSDVLHAKNANLRCTRDLLLPKLISGEVAVEDLDIRAL